ncbi:MAG: hypothetical protein LBD07_03930 [Spirochaetaceae bacterium]|jgi:hypothetical protein|nr:hypothetical protein [Spirochaetaceae bacterium]
MKKKYSHLALVFVIVMSFFYAVISIPLIRQQFVSFLCRNSTRLLLESIIGRTLNPLTLESNWDKFITKIIWDGTFLLILSAALYIELCVINFKRSRSKTAVVCITVLLYFSSMGMNTVGGDLHFHLDRIEELACAIRSGDIPTHFDYSVASKAGSGKSIDYPELFLYIPALLRVFGVPISITYILFYILINAATILIAYYSMNRITRSRCIALIFCALYSLCLYRLIDMNLRAAVGESLGMIFVPLTIAGIYGIFYEKDENGKRKWLTLAIAMSCILQSHVITFLLTSVFIAFFLIVNVRRINKQIIAAISKAAVVCILLNLWFIIPFISYYKYIRHTMPFDLYLTAVFPRQIFAPFVTDNSRQDLYTRDTTAGEMPLSLGITTLLGIIAFITVWKSPLFQRKVRFNGIKQFGTQALYYGLFALFMASTLFPWVSPPERSEWIPFNFFNHIQFAWRFFIIAAPLLCMTGSIGFYFFYNCKNGGGGAKTSYFSLYRNMRGR